MKNKVHSVASLIIVAFALVAIAFGFNASAQTTTQVAAQAPHPLSLPEIRSADLLRNKAMSLGRFGSRMVLSPSIDWSYTNTLTYIKTNGSCGEDVLKRLFSRPLTYRVENPQDDVQGYVYLYDTNCWDLLFWGYGDAVAATLTTNRLFHKLYLMDVPILDNVQSAEVIALDVNGQTANRYKLAINQCGQALFQYWMAGAPNGILSVKYNDDTLYTYSLLAPVAQVSGVVFDSGEYAIDGHYILTSTATSGAVLKIIELFNRPSAFLDLSQSQYVTLDVLGFVQDGNRSYFERPTAVNYVTEYGTTGTVAMDPYLPTSALLPGGKLRLTWSWTKFGQPGLLYTGPMGDGGGGIGKGKGS